MRNAIINRITDKADELARQYNISQKKNLTALVKLYKYPI